MSQAQTTSNAAPQAVVGALPPLWITPTTNGIALILVAAIVFLLGRDNLAISAPRSASLTPYSFKLSSTILLLFYALLLHSTSFTSSTPSLSFTRSHSHVLHP